MGVCLGDCGDGRFPGAPLALSLGDSLGLFLGDEDEGLILFANFQVFAGVAEEALIFGSVSIEYSERVVGEDFSIQVPYEESVTVFGQSVLQISRHLHIRDRFIIY